MKSNKSIVLIAIVAIAIVMTIVGIGGLACWHHILKTDAELYFYGRNRFDKYPPLVADARPVTCFNDRFYGVDKFGTDGFSIVGFESSYTYIVEGESYWSQSNIYHDSICSYGYNDSVIVVELISPEGNRYYIADNYVDSKKTKRIDADTGTFSNPLSYFGLTKWINDVNNPPIELIEAAAHGVLLLQWIIFFEVVCFIIVILMIIKLKKQPS
ncbi:MAG: hypothetical protein J6X65_06605 [Bacteroidales bacterium]|nr:hypothetical protein [Bacteroidales bacterium]